MKNYKKLLLISMVLGLSALSFTLINAQGQSETSNSACKIFPRVTPSGSYYPANANVEHNFAVGIDGDCDDACDFCDQFGTHCVDLYGCNCLAINGLECAGNKHNFIV